MKKQKSLVIDLAQSRRKRLTPSQYLNLTDAEKRNIEKVRFVAPTLGSDGFGSFIIRTKTPEFGLFNVEE